jgi:2-keto-4-pentenoate hydratase
VQSLEQARNTKSAIEPFSPALDLAIQIREKVVSARLEAGEQIVGLKIGGALESRGKSKRNNDLWLRHRCYGCLK